MSRPPLTLEEILEAAEPSLRRQPNGTALAYCESPESGERRSTMRSSKQRARQQALSFSREMESVGYVVARERNELILYRGSRRDAAGWRCVRYGLEWPLLRKPLAARYLLKPGSRLRPSPLAARVS